MRDRKFDFDTLVKTRHFCDRYYLHFINVICEIGDRLLPKKSKIKLLQLAKSDLWLGLILERLAGSRDRYLLNFEAIVY